MWRQNNIHHFFLEININSSKGHPRFDHRKISIYAMFTIYLQNAHQISLKNLWWGQNAIQTQNNMSNLTCLPILANGFSVGVAIFLAVVLFLFIKTLAFVYSSGVGVLHKDPIVDGGWNLVSFLSLDHSKLCSSSLSLTFARSAFELWECSELLSEGNWHCDWLIWPFPPYKWIEMV
jgi:hypothetical protein